MLPIKALPDLFVCLNKALQFFLKAVVLVVKIRHVLVQGIHLVLKLQLVLVHLVGMVLEPVNFVADRLLVLLHLLKVDRQLVQPQLGVFSINVLVLVGLE